MKFAFIFLVCFLFVSIPMSQAQEINIIKVDFPGPYKPKNKVNIAQTGSTNHFSTSASYKMEVEIKSNIPQNTSFNVRTYAIVSGARISLGDVRVGRAHSSGHVFASYYIFPSSANYYGQCPFVVVVDADNEITEKDESISSNEWKFQATIHPPGEQF
jgi:hypothetical protein